MDVRIRYGWVDSVRLALSVCCLAALQPASASQDSDDEAFVVIKAGKIVTMAGDDIRDGVIVIVNGKVRAVGKGLDYPGNAKFIDARSLVVMPGMINPHTRIGMPRYTRSGVHGDLTVAAEYLPNESLNKDLLDVKHTNGHDHGLLRFQWLSGVVVGRASYGGVSLAAGREGPPGRRLMGPSAPVVPTLTRWRPLH